MNQATERARALRGLEQGNITHEEYNTFIRILDEDYARSLRMQQPNQKVSETTTPTTVIVTSPAALPITSPTVVQKSPIEKITKEPIRNETERKEREGKEKEGRGIQGKEKERVIIIASFFILAIVGILWSVISTNGGLAGFATLDIPAQNYTNSTVINITQELTGIKITGFLYGEGTANIYYKTNNSTLLVGTITSNDGTPRTTNPSYAMGEEVTIENAPVSYNAYLDDGSTNVQVSVPFAAPNTSMTLLLVANDTGELKTYRIPIIIGSIPRTTTFSDLCIDTCTFAAAKGDIVIDTTGNTQITFTKIETTVLQNTPPILVVPFDAIVINQTTTINLAEHFVDADGDTLYYSTENTNLATLTIENNTLTLTPIQDGTQTITVYASDLKEIATGTIELTVTGMTIPEINVTTINETINNTIGLNITENISLNTTETNITLNETQNNSLDNTTVGFNITTNETITNTTINTTITNTTLDCSSANLNERPIDCLNINAQKLLAESIYWENIDRTKVARYTPVGNLLISGKVIPNAVGSAHSNDFTIVYSNSDYQTLATIWVDSSTGDLYLRGTLHEEQGNMLPPQGSYTVMNIRGVYLAYANAATGDLYLRGNLIPYRTNIQE